MPSLSENILVFIKEKFSPSQYSCLNEQLERFEIQKPFSGCKVLYAAPLSLNTLVAMLPIAFGGADLSVSWPEITTPDEKALSFLQTCGVPCYKKVPDTLSFDIILDCCGDHAAIESTRGYVELTRSGLAQYHNLKGKTCFDVDSNPVKNIETTLGTGDGLVRALKQSGYLELQGKEVLLFGFGKVGRGITRALQLEGLHVSVVELIEKPQKYNQSTINWISSNSKERVLSAVGDADFIVTATGVNGVIQNNYPIQPFLDSKAILINMGAVDEYGSDFPNEAILNNKTPLNFILDEPTSMSFIDPTLALYNECGALLASQSWDEGIQQPPNSIVQSLVDKFCGEHGYSREELMI
ncbi:PREDICTED: uncharacterized protein LOC109583023 [Amphimedon queenslandica]|uniref:S-adenosyl-L-homocysteine hydrolase NAD binding domain-containing protein n=1 Tax=Amphimedon queenslandica TaxID=400682 RepID=A0A1X7UJF0_AMPQE|nr:PREDICTED: uncharacterized protein LOC109583023 [Amphimedon queenslandica]|eukprot:XP_019853739.1 PREDICTED: uncharacterized protein LOC109583023 [Amphimedon queenslandica]